MNDNKANVNKFLGSGARVAVSPSAVVSRSWNTFDFKITLGRGGLAPGDSLGLLCGSNIDRWQFQFASHIWGCYTPWQVRDPAAPNYLTAKCSRKNAELDVRVGTSGGLKPFLNEADHFVHSLAERYRYVLELSCGKRLRDGDVISIRWGDTACGSPGVRAPCLALSYYFFPFIFSRLPRYDRELPFRQGDFSALPSIRVTGRPATRLHCALGPLAAKGERLRLHCAAIDEYGNLDEHFTGTVHVESSDKTAVLPARIVFSRRHKGRRRIDGIRFNGTGWKNILLRGNGIKSLPHPVLVSSGKPEEQIYFGELHGHTLDCDGTFPADEHYSYARGVAGLDFCALGSHSEYFGTQRAWKKYLQSATRAHKPGEFVVFYGYEWAGQGHTNAYFLNEDEVVNFHGRHILKGRVPKDSPPFRITCNRESRFLRLVKSLEVPSFCVGHFHSEYIPPADDSVIRLHEVYSMHQQNPLDKKLRHLLAQGLRLGVVAGSDSHRLPVGSLCPDPDAVWNQPVFIDGHVGSQSLQKKCGIQGVFAPALSRSRLYEAMKRRLTYGTTGARIVLLFEMNGARMGEEIQVKAGTPLHFHVRTGGTAGLAEICILKYDGKKWRNEIVKRDIGAASCDFRHTSPPARSDLIFYLRVTQDDGERAWSSPIWIRTEPNKRRGRIQ